jgi:hypothetical protein
MQKGELVPASESDGASQAATTEHAEAHYDRAAQMRLSEHAAELGVP